ncbi:MAG: Transcription factor Pcc1 [Thermoplasmata archaeon]|jgi:tRNA threonylcarbamoyladenosine modification (KEOPS) complex  Pcc1 subunit|nr:Transcription factor Pcc1 [Thermoplasmata archaeon]
MPAPAAGQRKHAAKVTLPCVTAEQAEWVRRAIQAEVDEAPDGAACTLSLQGADLEAEIQANDLAGLRAALNTLVRLADAALRTVQAGGPRRPS